MSQKDKKRAAKEKGSRQLSESYCLKMEREGEILGSNIISLVSFYGESFKGLVIETYGLCKAWALLKVVAKAHNFEVDELYNMLFPCFYEEMLRILEEEEILEK